MKYFVEIDGQRVLDLKLRELGDAKPFTDMEMGEPLAEGIREITEDRFQNAGYGWKELAPSTIASKESKFGSFVGLFTLVESGLLKESVTRKGAPGSILDIRPDELTIGTSVPYAKYHQTGTKKMAAREIFSLKRQEDQKKLQGIARKQASRYVRKLGFVQTEENF